MSYSVSSYECAACEYPESYVECVVCCGTFCKSCFEEVEFKPLCKTCAGVYTGVCCGTETQECKFEGILIPCEECGLNGVCGINCFKCCQCKE